MNCRHPVPQTAISNIVPLCCCCLFLFACCSLLVAFSCSFPLSSSLSTWPVALVPVSFLACVRWRSVVCAVILQYTATASVSSLLLTPPLFPLFASCLMLSFIAPQWLRSPSLLCRHRAKSRSAQPINTFLQRAMEHTKAGMGEQRETNNAATRSQTKRQSHRTDRFFPL